MTGHTTTAQGMPHDETARANAQLIAAAPDMLAALTNLLWVVDRTDGLPEDIETAANEARVACCKSTSI